MNILEIERLEKKYKNFSLENISFNIPEGSIMGLIGENGAGKSTIMNLITGAAVKDGGNIKIFGKDQEKLTYDDMAQVGTVMSGCGFPEELTADMAEKVLRGIYKTWDGDKFFGYAEKFGLPLKKKIRTFSTGMKMRFEIAAALSHGARLLLLDEVTNGLDPAARMEVLDMLLDFIQDERCSVLISSHIVGDLEKICDYITFIHDGGLVFSENKDELLEKYAVINADDGKLAELDENAVVSVRKTAVSQTALVFKDSIPREFETEKASVEDIMLYYLKRGERI